MLDRTSDAYNHGWDMYDLAKPFPHQWWTADGTRLANCWQGYLEAWKQHTQQLRDASRRDSTVPLTSRHWYSPAVEEAEAAKCFMALVRESIRLAGAQ